MIGEISVILPKKLKAKLVHAIEHYDDRPLTPLRWAVIGASVGLAVSFLVLLAATLAGR